jgi:hypothetical protein
MFVLNLTYFLVDAQKSEQLLFDKSWHLSLLPLPPPPPTN